MGRILSTLYSTLDEPAFKILKFIVRYDVSRYVTRDTALNAWGLLLWTVCERGRDDTQGFRLWRMIYHHTESLDDFNVEVARTFQPELFISKLRKIVGKGINVVISTFYIHPPALPASDLPQLPQRDFLRRFMRFSGPRFTRNVLLFTDQAWDPNKCHVAVSVHCLWNSFHWSQPKHILGFHVKKILSHPWCA